MKMLRATGVPPGADREAVPDVEARFRELVQSPLRAGLLRYLHAQPERWFEIRSLMAAFGSMHLDVSNCLAGLVEFGVARRADDGASVYSATWPTRSATAALLRAFLEQRPDEDTGERSPAARRFRETVARDEKMLVVLEWIRTAAKSDLPVLIVGPDGSDTHLAARMIHELGRHARETFRLIDCAALPEAPEGPGVFGLGARAALGAPRGTVLLEGVHHLSLLAQAALLAALHQGQPEGGADGFRIISTSARPLDADVHEGRFREELYRAINGFAIRLPALAERPADVLVLADRFLARAGADQGVPTDARAWSPAARARLQEYPWPGDVRELQEAVTHAVRAAAGGVIDARDLPLPATGAGESAAAAGPLPTLRQAEQVHIGRVLDAVGWNKKEAARVLDISRGTLYRKIQEYGLAPEGRTRGHAR